MLFEIPLTNAFACISEHQQPLLLIDKSVDVKQIKVAESFGVMIIRYDKGTIWLLRLGEVIP